MSAPASYGATNDGKPDTSSTVAIDTTTTPCQQQQQLPLAAAGGGDTTSCHSADSPSASSHSQPSGLPPPLPPSTATAHARGGLDTADNIPFADNTAENNRPNEDHSLYLYHEEIEERPRVVTLVNSLANYNAIMPSASDRDQQQQQQKKRAKLGTMIGVFLPCIQNIFGVIFFIRLTWIVGTAGAIESFLVVLMCCSVTLMTSISMSAIATNGVVPGGGSYFMISRALGPEFGGAVGILFYLGTTFASAMYVVGAIEILLLYVEPRLAIGDESNKFNNFRLYGTILLLVMATVVFFGVRFVSIFATIALGCVLTSLVLVYVGIFVNINGSNALMTCQVGERLLIEDPNDPSNASCTPQHLWSEFCRGPFNISNTTSCYYYFADNINRTHYLRGIQGIASNAFQRNLYSRYPPQDNYITENGSSVAAKNLGQGPHNQILADITTSFTVLIGIFFPSCTGIMAGSNRSGDLADASRSIPVGTIAAVLVTSTVYLSGTLLFAATLSPLLLLDKFGVSVGKQLVVAQVAWPHPMVVTAGALLSTIGAGLQSLTGAPRLLQAIAQDNILPVLRPMAASSSRGEPVRALLLTALISEIGILIGNLDQITPIITMFFLMCYGFVNLACALQTLLRTPNWRPRFRYYHWALSFLGLSLCITVMFMTSWYYALIAMALAFLIYKYIEFRGAEKEWGDGIRGLALSAARFALLRLEEGPPHTKNWRPQLLVFVKLNSELNVMYPKLITFASQLKAGKGLTMVLSVIEGEFSRQYGEAQAARQSVRKEMEKEKVKGFADVLVAKNITQSIDHYMQTAGLGGLRPNTVVLGWPYGWRHQTGGNSYHVFLNTVRHASNSKLALLALKGITFFPTNTEKMSGNIDVWWIVHDGGLLMLLPFLLTQSRAWKGCRMRIFTIAQQSDNSIQIKKDLKMFLYQLRIEAEVDVVEMDDSDITAYTYERTLMMEQRNQMMQEMRLTRKQRNSVVQNIVDRNTAEITPTRRSNVRFRDHPSVSRSYSDREEDDSPGDQHEEEEQRDGDRIPRVPTITEDLVEASETTETTPSSPPPASSSAHQTSSNSTFKNLLDIKPDQANVRRMHTAVKLNEVIVRRSHDAQLVIVNLPGPPKLSSREADANYMEFLEVLTESLERVLMVRGGGREVITIYS